MNINLPKPSSGLQEPFSESDQKYGINKGHSGDSTHLDNEVDSLSLRDACLDRRDGDLCSDEKQTTSNKASREDMGEKLPSLPLAIAQAEFICTQVRLAMQNAYLSNSAALANAENRRLPYNLDDVVQISIRREKDKDQMQSDSYQSLVSIKNLKKLNLDLQEKRAVLSTVLSFAQSHQEKRAVLEMMFAFVQDVKDKIEKFLSTANTLILQAQETVAALSETLVIILGSELNASVLDIKTAEAVLGRVDRHRLLILGKFRDVSSNGTELDIAIAQTKEILARTLYSQSSIKYRRSSLSLINADFEQALSNLSAFFIANIQLNRTDIESVQFQANTMLPQIKNVTSSLENTQARLARAEEALEDIQLRKDALIQIKLSLISLGQVMRSLASQLGNIRSQVNDTRPKLAIASSYFSNRKVLIKAHDGTKKGKLGLNKTFSWIEGARKNLNDMMAKMLQIKLELADKFGVVEHNIGTIALSSKNKAPTELIEIIFEESHNKLNVIRADIEKLQAELDEFDTTDDTSKAGQLSNDSLEIRLALSRVSEALYTIEAIKNIANSYEQRLQIVRCYTANLKKYRDCIPYHANLAKCKDYYVDFGYCLDIENNYCLSYRRRLMHCEISDGGVSRCENYNETKHEECFNVPELCEGTILATLDQHKNADREQLRIVRSRIADQERQLGFKNHEWNDSYSKEMQSDAITLQKKLVQEVAKNLVTLYGEENTRTLGAAKNLLRQFQADYCDIHGCLDGVEQFSIVGGQNGACSYVRFYNTTTQKHMQGAIETFDKFVDAVCCGDVACICEDPNF